MNCAVINIASTRLHDFLNVSIAQSKRQIPVDAFFGSSTAAAGATYGAVTFYSEDTGVFDVCSVVQE